MKISVILPYKNAESTLGEAVLSILNQSYKNLELVVIDDHSQDTGKTMVEKWANLDSRILSLTNSGNGIVAALNTGLAAAGGEYIARMDADDLALPERLEKQLEKLMGQPDLGLTSCLVEHWSTPDQEKDEGFQKYIQWVNSLVSMEDIYLNRFIESPLPHPTVLFKRELIVLFGGYQDGDFPEDYELWLRWLKNGVKMEKVNEVLLKWRDGSGRLSRVDQRYRPDAFYQIKTAYLAEHLIEIGKKQVWIWGAGRKSRQRVRLLQEYGIEIVGFIDIKPQKTTLFPCVTPDQIPESGQWFILSYVGKWGAREQIRVFLQQKGYREGADFLVVG